MERKKEREKRKRKREEERRGEKRKENRKGKKESSFYIDRNVSFYSLPHFEHFHGIRYH